MQCPAQDLGIKELEVAMGNLSLLLTEIGGHQSGNRKWIHSFEDVTAIIFTVDLADYDHVSLGGPTQNRIQESLHLFESIVNSCWFKRASVLLFLTNVASFRTKLSKIPLSDYFPDYAGGESADRATKYILWHFNQANTANLTLYPYLTELSEPGNPQVIFDAVRDTIIQKTLSRLESSWRRSTGIGT